MRKILISLILLNFQVLCGKSITEMTDFPAFCLKAAQNEKVFNNFKRDPAYTNITEHVTFEQGNEYLKTIKKEFPEILTYSDLFRENDILGNPYIFDYGKDGWFSPTTLRYMKVAGDLKKRFGDLSQMHIVEIGGGCGGQCKVISDLCGFASYTLIELPQVNELAKKYLDILGVSNVNYINSDNINAAGTYDLVISNFGFSELDRTTQDAYLQKVVLPARKGYMTMNFTTKLFGIESMSMLDIISAFRNRNEKIERETPLTSSNNILLIWNQ